MNRDSLRDLLIQDEGLELMPYKDSLGKLTIGVGRCLDTVGITKQEAFYLLENDMSKAVSDCRDKIPCFNQLDDIRQNVLASMCFNMGIEGLLEFKKVLSCVAAKDFTQASMEMMNSKWASQVGKRAVRLAEMMRAGQIPN